MKIGILHRAGYGDAEAALDIILLKHTDYDSQQHRSSGNNDIAWIFYITDVIANNPKFQEELKNFRYHYEDLLLVNEAQE
jgi:hypothetical protein